MTGKRQLNSESVHDKFHLLYLGVTSFDLLHLVQVFFAPNHFHGSLVQTAALLEFWILVELRDLLLGL